LSGYFGDTFANGDGTDSWCRSGALVNQTLYYGGSYVPPKCDELTCFYFIMSFSYPPGPQIHSVNMDQCKINFGTEGRHFLCQ
jgi:hypothetical protein